MDILEFHQAFDLIIDKVQSAYLTSDEKDKFIQMATFDMVNSFFKPNNGKYNAESHSYDDERIYPLIEEVEVTSDIDGMISYTQLNNQLTTGAFMYILKVFQQKGSSDSCLENGEGYEYSQFVRHNNLGPRLRNAFKKPTQENPIHLYYNTYLEIHPKEEKNVTITVVRTPAKATLDDPTDDGIAGPGAVNVDFPEAVHNEILLLALRKAGISIREKEFYAFVQNDQDQVT